MIIFGHRSYILSNPQQDGCDCPQCKSLNSLTIGRSVGYVHIFWIPIFPYKNKILTYCNTCNSTRYQREIPLEETERLKQAGLPKRPIYYFTGLILIALFFISASVAAVISKSKEDEYLKNPKVGDVYTIKTNENGEKGYTLYKIAQITKDSITFDVNDYYVTRSSKLKELKVDNKDDYSSELVIPLSELSEMKKNNIIYRVER